MRSCFLPKTVQVKSLPTGHDPAQCPRLGARRAHQRAPGPGSRCGRSEIVVAFVSLGAGYLLSSGAQTPTMFKLPIYRERLAYFLRLWAFIKLNIVESPPIDAADTALKTTKAWINAADTAPLSFRSCCIRFFSPILQVLRALLVFFPWLWPVQPKLACLAILWPADVFVISCFAMLRFFVVIRMTYWLSSTPFVVIHPRGLSTRLGEPKWLRTSISGPFSTVRRTQTQTP